MEAYEPKDEFMRLAIARAREAKNLGDYAIGAVVVLDDVVLAASGNRVKLDHDPTQHAEIAAIRLACAARKQRHIEGAVLYTTAEPCPMCAAAAIWARFGGIVSGSTILDMADFRDKFGNQSWTWRTVDVAAHEILTKGDPRPFFVEGFLRDECRDLFHDR